MPLRVRGLLPVVLAVVLAEVVASCGSPDEETGAAKRTPATTSQSPTEPTSAPPPRRDAPRTTVTFVGDIMLGRGVAAAHPDDPIAPLRPMRPLLHGSDLTVGNLESALSDKGSPTQGDDSFAAVPLAHTVVYRRREDA